MAEPSAFGALLYRQRLVARLTQEALAERARLSVRAISDLERGERRTPYRHTVRALAEALCLGPVEQAAFEAAATRIGNSVPRLTFIDTDQISPAPASTQPANIPDPLTSFVGREQELLELRDLLRRARLVTLTGPGGTGKTRLALAGAMRVVADFPDGIFFVDLSEQAESSQVLSVIAQVLDLHVVEGPGMLGALVRYLRSRRVLFVLDNFEQVVAASREVAALLSAVPALHVLVTSRVALHLMGEREFPVPPLPVPLVGAAGDPTLLQENAAVALFVARAQDVRPDFELTAANASAVAAICRRVDGLPLAIELAAARVRVLAPDSLLTRLETPMQVLTGGGRDRPERQQTLKATIAWSYDLLDSAEQLLFRRLSIFAGGWTLEAAEAVCSIEGDPPCSVLDGLSALVEKSLVRSDDGVEGRPRFNFLSTIRSFALDQLANMGEKAALQQWHAAYFSSLAEAAEPELIRRDPWMRRLLAEQDNIRAVLNWAIEGGDAELAMRLIGNLWGWYYRTGPSEGRRWAETLLAMPAARTRTLGRAHALFVAGIMALIQAADVTTARRHLTESVGIYREVGDVRWLGLALPYLGLAMAIQGDRSARLLALEGVAAIRQAKDWWRLVVVLSTLGQVEATIGDTSAARRYYEQSVTLLRVHDPEREMPVRGAVFAAVAALAFGHGDDAAAHAACEEALGSVRGTVSVRNTALLLTNLGYVVARRGDRGQARTVFAESLALAREHSLPVIFASCLGGLGVLLAETEPEQAVRLFSAAEAAFAATGAGLWPVDLISYRERLAAVRSALRPDAFAAAWQAGQTVTTEQAVTQALESTG